MPALNLHHFTLSCKARGRKFKFDYQCVSTLEEVPQDGVYNYTASVTVNADMAKISKFGVGFRCDFWSDGAFRVRKVKVEKGDTVSERSAGM